MAALTEYIPDVIAYLLAQAAANVFLGGAAVPVQVIDGPPLPNQVLLNPAGVTQRLYVGSDGDLTPGAAQAAATAEQGFAFLDQARTRDDQIEVMCVAEAGSGDSVMANARGSGGTAGGGAFAVMAAVELMLRGSPGTTPASPGDATMGGLVQWSEVTGPVQLRQRQMQDGAWAQVGFRVSAFLRLTS